MRKENPRHLRTALVVSLLLHASLLTALVLNFRGESIHQPDPPAAIPIKVQFWNPQSRVVPPTPEEEKATAEATTTRTPSSGPPAPPRVSVRASQPAITPREPTDADTGTQPQLDMANIRSGIDDLSHQRGKELWQSGEDWCQDQPPRRPGEPCKTTMVTTTASQQAIAATVSTSLAAHDQNCRFSKVKPHEVHPPKSDAPTADFEPRGGAAGGFSDLLGFIEWTGFFLLNC